MEQFKIKLIHAAYIQQNRDKIYLLLYQIEPFRFIWFKKEPTGDERETSIWGGTAAEALLSAYKFWHLEEIKTLNCGFRYSLPERDEVGVNALLHQMISSYSSPSGIYFDEELSANCIVQFASSEARSFWSYLQKKEL